MIEYRKHNCAHEGEHKMSFLAESYIQKYGKVEKFLKGQSSIDRYCKVYCNDQDSHNDDQTIYNEQFGQSCMSGFGMNPAF